jgi:hypothetical protein
MAEDDTIWLYEYKDIAEIQCNSFESKNFAYEKI